MRLKQLTKLLALAVCLCLMLTGCIPPPPASSGNGDGTGRNTVNYSEMTYERPDIEGMKTRLEELTEALKSAGSLDDIKRIDEECDALYENFYTMRTLAMLKKYHDVNDSFYEEEYRLLDDASVDMSNLGNDYNRAITEGAFADAYREYIGDYRYQSMLDGLRLNSREVEAYKKERNQLNTDYNKLLSTATLVYEGESYTLEDITAMEYPMYYLLLVEFYSTNAPQFAEMYARMIELDKLTATTLGFDSPAEMYYLSYARDYSPANGLALCEESKGLFVPLLDAVYSVYPEAGEVTRQAAFDKMPTALENTNSELAEAWSFMLQYGLYDVDPLPSKQTGVSFTTELYAYDAPFLYTNWGGGFGDVTTTMHEFGHFYDNWLHYDEDVVFNLDIAETYSQGLELLLHKYYGEFTDYPEEGQMQNLQGFMNVLTYQCLLEEFQQILYEMDTLDSTSIGQVYAQLLDGYGFGSYMVDENGADNSWFEVTHLFDAPFYTISYVTSAVAALQIWAESQEDWDAAVATYMQLIHADQNQPFTQLLESAGLKAPHDPAALEEIAGYFSAEFGGSGYVTIPDAPLPFDDGDADPYDISQAA